MELFQNFISKLNKDVLSYIQEILFLNIQNTFLCVIVITEHEDYKVAQIITSNV